MKTCSGPVRVALVITLFLSVPFLAKGQTRLYFESLFAYDYELVSGEADKQSCGLHGKYLNFRFDGQICDNLSFSYRQRLNKNTDATFFSATDWLHLDWKVTPKIQLSAGKQVVAIGGYEYDRAPIDLYYCSEFWNNIPCYQIGVSAAFNVSDNDQLLLQVCNSPMRSWAGNNSYAVNFMWYGSHGFYETMWSANAIQCVDGFIYYLALGNRFNITDWLRWDIDLMDRYTPKTNAFGNLSLMTELSGCIAGQVRIHGKYTYDVHKASELYDDMLENRDYLVLPGTELQMVSGGVEYHPLRKDPDFVKLFASAGYSWGVNGNPSGTMIDKGLKIQAGLKFRLDILRSVSFIKEKIEK